MRTCHNCACDPVCDHNWNGWETCGNWIQKPGKPPTNADRIRAMSDEELSEFISRIEIGDFGQQVYGKTFCDMCKGQYECDDCILWWLQQPAEES